MPKLPKTGIVRFIELDPRMPEDRVGNEIEMRLKGILVELSHRYGPLRYSMDRVNRCVVMVEVNRP